MNTLTITRPDDWHLHVRDGAHLSSVVPFTALQFGRAVIMPNLKPPVTTIAQAQAYRERILAAVPKGSQFEPLMTLYLTESTAPSEIKAARASGIVVGAKLYPAGATTHSDAGVTSIDKIFPVLEAMQEADLVFQVHGEVTDQDVDVFDREAVFIDRVMARVVQEFPRLRVVFEHVTTREAVQFVQSSRPGVAATVTPQHLLLNRNAIFQGGIRPHNYCLPVLKREQDRNALVAAATSDDARFFLGTDSAPHARHTKEDSCGCAGIFSAHAAIELYAECFELAGRLDRLQSFASERGPDFYRLPRNSTQITLERTEWKVPATYSFGGDELVPFRAGESLPWRLIDQQLEAHG
ncbi:MAG TPA: dihydroorotase [Steroidobacteraceae bacterium]|nr:dihydroorotase [Steroidobacteraceae bacterium]